MKRIRSEQETDLQELVREEKKAVQLVSNRTVSRQQWYITQHLPRQLVGAWLDFLQAGDTVRFLQAMGLSGRTSMILSAIRSRLVWNFNQGDTRFFEMDLLLPPWYNYVGNARVVRFDHVHFENSYIFERMTRSIDLESVIVNNCTRIAILSLSDALSPLHFVNKTKMRIFRWTSDCQARIPAWSVEFPLNTGTLKTLAKNWSRLEVLDIRTTQQPAAANNITRALKHLPNLTELQLDGVLWDAELVNEVAHHCPQLQILVLDCNVSELYDAFGHRLYGLHWSNDEEIEAKSDAPLMQAIADVFHECRQLTFLQLTMQGDDDAIRGATWHCHEDQKNGWNLDMTVDSEHPSMRNDAEMLETIQVSPWPLWIARCPVKKPRAFLKHLLDWCDTREDRFVLRSLYMVDADPEANVTGNKKLMWPDLKRAWISDDDLGRLSRLPALSVLSLYPEADVARYLELSEIEKGKWRLETDHVSNKTLEVFLDPNCPFHITQWFIREGTVYTEQLKDLPQSLPEEIYHEFIAENNHQGENVTRLLLSEMHDVYSGYRAWHQFGSPYLGRKSFKRLVRFETNSVIPYTERLFEQWMFEQPDLTHLAVALYGIVDVWEWQSLRRLKVLRIRQLDRRDNKIGYQQGALNDPTLGHLCTNNPDLTYLTLNLQGTEVTNVASVELKHLRKLVLTINGTSVDVGDLRQLKRQCPKLKHLHIRFSPSVPQSAQPESKEEDDKADLKTKKIYLAIYREFNHLPPYTLTSEDERWWSMFNHPRVSSSVEWTGKFTLVLGRFDSNADLGDIPPELMYMIRPLRTGMITNRHQPNSDDSSQIVAVTSAGERLSYGRRSRAIVINEPDRTKWTQLVVSQELEKDKRDIRRQLDIETRQRQLEADKRIVFLADSSSSLNSRVRAQRMHRQLNKGKSVRAVCLATDSWIRNLDIFFSKANGDVVIKLGLSPRGVQYLDVRRYKWLMRELPRLLSIEFGWKRVTVHVQVAI